MTKTSFIAIYAIILFSCAPSYAQQSQSCSQTCDQQMQKQVDEFHRLVKESGKMGEVEKPSKIMSDLQAIAGKAIEIGAGYEACFQSNCPGELEQ